MSKIIDTITKEEIVESATSLIHKLENLKEDAEQEAMELGYNQQDYKFNPKCDWREINDSEVKLIFKLEISEKE